MKRKSFEQMGPVVKRIRFELCGKRSRIEGAVSFLERRGPEDNDLNCKAGED